MKETLDEQSRIALVHYRIEHMDALFGVTAEIEALTEGQGTAT